MKNCTRCGEKKPLDLYYRDNSLRDGRTNICKKCKDRYQRQYHLKHKERRKETHRAYNERNREKIREKNRANYQAKREKKLAYLAEWRKKNRDLISTYNRQRKEKNAERIKAGKAVRAAIKRGEISVDNSCCVCGATNHVDLHHQSYDEANHFKVIPLCRAHHQRLHAEDPETLTAVRPHLEALGLADEPILVSSTQILAMDFMQ